MNCAGQSHETVSINHVFWRERWAEAGSLSAYQPSDKVDPLPSAWKSEQWRIVKHPCLRRYVCVFRSRFDDRSGSGRPTRNQVYHYQGSKHSRETRHNANVSPIGYVPWWLTGRMKTNEPRKDSWEVEKNTMECKWPGQFVKKNLKKEQNTRSLAVSLLGLCLWNRDAMCRSAITLRQIVTPSLLPDIADQSDSAPIGLTHTVDKRVNLSTLTHTTLARWHIICFGVVFE